MSDCARYPVPTSNLRRYINHSSICSTSQLYPSQSWLVVSCIKTTWPHQHVFALFCFKAIRWTVDVSLLSFLLRHRLAFLRLQQTSRGFHAARFFASLKILFWVLSIVRQNDVGVRKCAVIYWGMRWYKNACLSSLPSPSTIQTALLYWKYTFQKPMSCAFSPNTNVEDHQTCLFVLFSSDSTEGCLHSILLSKRWNVSLCHNVLTYKPPILRKQIRKQRYSRICAVLAVGFQPCMISCSARPSILRSFAFTWWACSDQHSRDISSMCVCCSDAKVFQLYLMLFSPLPKRTWKWLMRIVYAALLSARVPGEKLRLMLHLRSHNIASTCVGFAQHHADL